MRLRGSLERCGCRVSDRNWIDRLLEIEVVEGIENKVKLNLVETDKFI